MANEEKKYTHVYSNTDYHKNEVKNVVVENHTMVDTDVPVNPKMGQPVYNTTTNQMGYWNGTEWVYGGESGALHPVGTLGNTAEPTKADFGELPTATASVKEGHSYFVVTDGEYEGRKARIGDFFFARPRKKGDDYIWKTLKAFYDATNDKLVYLVDGAYHVDGTNAYFDDKTEGVNNRKLFNADGSAYEYDSVEDEGFVIQDPDGDNKCFVAYKKSGAETKSEAKTTEDVAGGHPVWALVPAGNGFVTADIEGETDTLDPSKGKSTFEIENTMGTTKCIVSVTAYENTKAGYEIAGGEVVLVDTVITPEKIILNFGHDLFESTETDPDKDNTKFEAKITYC